MTGCHGARKTFLTTAEPRSQQALVERQLLWVFRPREQVAAKSLCCRAQLEVLHLAAAFADDVQ